MGAILEARLKEMRATKEPNCIGTALYLIGEIKTPERIDVHDAEKHLRKMKPTRDPEIGSIVAAYTIHEGARVGRRTLASSLEVVHMGVVTSVQPVRVTHRPSSGYVLQENESINEAFSEYSGYNMGYFKSRR